MAEEQPTKQFSIRLPADIIDRLDRVAKKNDRNRTQELLRALKAHLEKEEDGDTHPASKRRRNPN